MRTLQKPSIYPELRLYDISVWSELVSLRLRTFLFPVFSLLLSVCQLLLSQQVPTSQVAMLPSNDPPSTLWRSEHARHIFGLPGVKPSMEGTLTISPAGVVFFQTNGEASIERANVMAVSVGNERMEKGGTIGKIGRKLPYGGGQLLALVAQGKVDLLTIEFRDQNDAYHGVVFALPQNEAEKAKEVFSSPSVTPVLQHIVEDPHPPCISGSFRVNTAKVSPIAVVGAPIPTEYKVLLYEQLVRHLEKHAGLEHIFRDGDRSPEASCPQMNLTVSLSAFRKGNAVLRASTGPLSTFGVGATKLRYHVLLQDYQGRMMLDQDLKASKSGDSESLDIADTIAKRVAKKLKKCHSVATPS